MITRSKMQRQLYRGGGIADLYPRTGFLFGGIKRRIRKLIPNELADVAVQAAPFVAPFNPAVAAAMRGIGRFDQRGSMSDAFKQAALMYGGGQLARGIGGAGFQGNPFTEGGAFRGGLEGFKSGFSSPLSPERTQGIRDLFKGKDTPSKKSYGDSWQETFSGGNPGGEFANTITRGTTDKISLKGIMDKWQSLPPGMRTAIVGVGSGSLAGLAQWFENQIPQEPGENMNEYLARRNAAVGDLMLQYLDNTRAYDADWTSKTLEQKKEEIARLNKNQGGRGGYSEGSWEAEWDEIYEDYKLKQIELGKEFVSKEEFIDMYRDNNAQGGRIGQMHGTGPAGLPGIPRMAPDGMEFDMRMNGGFQPLGAKEGKDDVPAMLAKNEFVFTADAVRGAGNGDIELGAQRMYDTMKNLEKRMA